MSVWFAVNKNGDGRIFENKPKRMNEIGIWDSEGNFGYMSINYIRMKIGRDLTWEDEPKEVREDALFF